MHWLKGLSLSAYVKSGNQSTTVRFALPLAFLTTDTHLFSGEPKDEIHVRTQRERERSAPWPHTWVHRFNQQGYSTVTIYLPSQPSEDETPNLQIQLGGQATSFFPPLLFSKGRLECLLAQTYVSSNPLSGLVLISPPPKDSTSFDFEPRFPTLIMSTVSKTSKNAVDHLMINEGDSNMTDQTTFDKVKEWMDNNGF
ncbi:hypothetical protein DFH28DRAFT_1082336 [Melampsora americana]|nr:hypothetical protein DFH28DRAFT_1082336 [Melampsora americana]